MNKTVITKQKGDVTIRLEVDPENGINEHTWRYLMARFAEVLKAAGYVGEDLDAYSDCEDENW